MLVGFIFVFSKGNNCCLAVKPCFSLGILGYVMQHSYFIKANLIRVVNPCMSLEIIGSATQELVFP